MTEQTSGLLGWLDARLPVVKTWKTYAAEYYVPKNLNFWYVFGVFSLVVLINQILTGIWLTMYYTPTPAEAFGSVEHIMRHVNYGWLIRYMHSTGASIFFIVVYLHIYRGIMYGSSKKPRELVWLIGMLLYVLLVVESASGYALPWGQMSYWAIKVLVSVFSVVPLIGKQLVVLIQGDYNVSGVTLHRFFSFHVIAFPLLILLLAYLHIVALHAVGSNNPDGIDIRKKLNEKGKPLDGIPFHPYYTVKDFCAVILLLTICATIIFFMPKVNGYFIEHANFAQANPLVTPTHIAPPWYFAPFYSILRAIPNKMLGVGLTGGAIFILFLLPWLDRSPVRSIRYRGVWTKVWLTIFVISFGGLGFFGTMPLSDVGVVLSRIFTTTYYLFFLLMPFYTKYEKTLTPPERVNYK